MKTQIVARLAIYIIFRFVHFVLLFESDIYALFLRIFDKSKSDEVEVLNIFARFQFDSTDVLSESDYLCFYDRTTLFEEICEEGWFINNITDRYVYFVKIGSTDSDQYDSLISIDQCSKLSKFLFENAEKLARIDVETFERVSKTLPPFKSKVVMLHSAPCSGGTVAAKLLQSCDKTKRSLLVIGEPPGLTSLSILYNSLSIEEMKNICKSSLRFMMLHQKENQTIVMKARSSCTKIVPYIHSGCPSIQHIFIAKQQYEDVISRLVLYTSTHLPVFQLICWLMGQAKCLTDTLTFWRLMEADMIRKIRPKTDVEFGLAQVFGSIINYRKNLKYFVGESIDIDDLISDTATNVRPLLNICDVSDLAIPECIEWKRASDEMLKNVWNTVQLTDDDSERIQTLIQLIDQHNSS